MAKTSSIERKSKIKVPAPIAIYDKNATIANFADVITNYWASLSKRNKCRKMMNHYGIKWLTDSLEIGDTLKLHKNKPIFGFLIGLKYLNDNYRIK